jgi:hypothetical protein
VIYRLAGDWSPRSTHPTLLAIQLVVLWQAGLRGLDYADGTVGGLDHAAGNPLYGWLLYASTALVLLGLAIRRGGPVILGHALLGSWYLGLGWDALLDLGVSPGRSTVAGVASAALGVWVLLDKRSRTGFRLLGVGAMLAGQYLVVTDLAGDYRTGTGLLSAGVQHGILAVGTFVLWQRQRLRRVVEDDRAP